MEKKLITYLCNNGVQFIVTNKQFITYPSYSSPVWEKLLCWSENSSEIELPNKDTVVVLIPLSDLTN